MKRFQNHIAESRFAFPVTLVPCMSVWLLSDTDIPTFTALLVAAIIMVELNNSNVLLRIFSRMVSCCFLVLMTMATTLSGELETKVSALSFAFFLYAIFHTYQDRHATGWVFYAFLSLAADSMVFPQILFFVPLLWILMATRLISMTIKTFVASILGLITPYIFAAAYHLYTSHLPSLALDISSFTFQLTVPTLTIKQVILLVYVLLCTIIGTIHYLRTRQQDRIKTQLLYEMIITINIVAILFLALQPQHFNSLIGIIIVCTSPLIAHFIALTNTKWTNLLTKLLLLLAVGITLCALLAPTISPSILKLFNSSILQFFSWTPSLNF